MCIVIDINALAAVFEPGTSLHSEFRPVLKWITSGNGKIVYGGTKYKNELARAKKYLSLLAEFKKANKLVEVSTLEVDAVEASISKAIDNNDFDDPHIVAIIIVSGCRLICTLDSRSHRFLKAVDLYPKGVKRPKIYSCSKQKRLLCDASVVNCCRPTVKAPELWKRYTK